jgi:hypothetical protein
LYSIPNRLRIEQDGRSLQLVMNGAVAVGPLEGRVHLPAATTAWHRDQADGTLIKEQD